MTLWRLYGTTRRLRAWRDAPDKNFAADLVRPSQGIEDALIGVLPDRIVADMKWLLVAAMAAGLASQAVAADAPAAQPAVKAPAPAEFNWTGCYVGVSGGGNWGHSEDVARTAAGVGPTITGNFNLNGEIAGGTVGCNYQIEKTVMGIENDASWTNKRGTASDLPPFNVRTTNTTREKWIDTLRGRVGYAWDQVLIYGTAGIAFAGTDAIVTNPVVGSVKDSRTRTGLAAGLGVEWAAWVDTWGAVSFKVEYLHTDFGSKSYFNPPPVLAGGVVFTVLTRDIRLTDDIVRAGVNVKFNWDDKPVVTKF